ncbi:MAG: LEA14-like dessication related protein [Vicingaceae bacterium]|jgi:LEA14-like dessication related protein
MKKLFQIGLFLILTVSLSSCWQYEEVTITNIKQVKLVKFSEKGLVVESQIKIKNPNGFKLSVVDSEFDIYVKGNKLAKASIDGKVSIPKNSEEYHTVVMRSKYEDFADGALVNMLALTFGSREVDFKVDGYVTGEVFFIKKKVRVTHEERVPLKLY